MVDDLIDALVDDGGEGGGQGAEQVGRMGMGMCVCVCLCLGLGLSVGVGVWMMDGDGGVGRRVNMRVNVDVHVRVGHKEGLVVVDVVTVWVRHGPEVSESPVDARDRRINKSQLIELTGGWLGLLEESGGWVVVQCCDGSKGLRGVNRRRGPKACGVP